MAIKKLQEFARDGQKNTDNLSLTDGFSVTRKPARQWFNYLFNMLSLKINEIIDLDPIARTEIVDNLTTDDATKPVSAKQAKILQDTKVNKSEIGSNPNQIPLVTSNGVLGRGYGYLAPALAVGDLAKYSYVTGWYGLAGVYSNAPVTTTMTGQMLVSIRTYGAGPAMVFQLWNNRAGDYWIGTCGYTNNTVDRTVTPSGAISWRRVAYTDSNVESATKLQTARTINGIDFDGTKNITLPAATISISGTVQLNNTLTSTSTAQALTANMGKKLQDEKFAISDLVNDLTTGGVSKALTAEQGKLLFGMFGNLTNENGFQKIPNPSNPNYPLIIQWFVGNSDNNGILNITNIITFPNKPIGGLANEAAPGGWEVAGNEATVWGFDLAGSTKTHSVARVRKVSPNNVVATFGISGRIVVWGY